MRCIPCMQCLICVSLGDVWGTVRLMTLVAFVSFERSPARKIKCLLRLIDLREAYQAIFKVQENY